MLLSDETGREADAREVLGTNDDEDCVELVSMLLTGRKISMSEFQFDHREPWLGLRGCGEL